MKLVKLKLEVEVYVEDNKDLDKSYIEVCVDGYDVGCDKVEWEVIK